MEFFHKGKVAKKCHLEDQIHYEGTHQSADIQWSTKIFLQIIFCWSVPVSS